MNKITEQDKYNKFLRSILKERLFETGKELNRLLVETYGIADTNARKIVSRAVISNNIASSKPYTFGQKQYIYYLPGHALTYEELKTICRTNRPPMYRLLNSLDDYGIISYYEALKLTASPDEQSSTKVQSLDDILKILTKLNLVYTSLDANNVSYILKKDTRDKYPEGFEIELMKHHYSKMVIDCSLLPDILRWLYHTNFIATPINSYRNKKSPSIGAKHNNILWDAFSYSKATGINPIVGVKADTTEKQTLVVLDVVLSGEYTQDHLDGFLARIQINKHSVKNESRKIMPIIVYKHCHELVLNRMGKLGFIAFDIGSIFGARIYAVLKSLDTLTNLPNTDNVEDEVRGILKAIREAGQEDALRDLKGVLFEILMYPLLAHLYPNASMMRGKTLTAQIDDKKVYYEYDYIIDSSTPSEIIVVELKGYSSTAHIPLGHAEIKSSLKWFFRRTFPFAQAILKEKGLGPKPIKAVYLTSANFWDDGKSYIDKMNKSKLKPSKLNTGYSRVDLLALLKENGFTKEIEIIEQFYI